MAKLNIDFAFEGFRIIRERPWLILFWGVILLVCNLVMTTGLTYLVGGAVRSFNEVAGTPTSDPEQAMAMLGSMGQIYLILLPVSFAVQAVLACAVYRAVLDDKAPTFGFLRLGGAELRQFALYFIALLLLIGAGAAVGLAGGIVALVLTTVLSLISPQLGIVGTVIGVVVLYGVLIWLMIRMSLAPVQTFDQKKLNLFGSWALTQGHAWTLLGGYIVMIIMVILVAGLCFAIFAVGAIALSGGNFGALSPLSNMGIPLLETYADPLVLTYVVLMNLVVSPLVMALMLGASAGAYRQLVGTSAIKAERIF